MSMNATFVQVDAGELAALQADPDAAEALFSTGSAASPAIINLSAAMQERVRAAGPQPFAEALGQLDPALRAQLEQQLGVDTATLASGGGAEVLLNLLRARRSRAAAAPGAQRAVLELDKAWHGVQYLLSGRAEPGPELLSQPVMGGTDLGDDDEGFSGYGPARYFTPAQVGELAETLNRPEVEAAAVARFDTDTMTELGIYPGMWLSDDEEWALDAFRRLRAFYADAASQGHAIVTCLL